MAYIVVIGAGISGLTTALLLSRNPKYKVAILAKHMPGDYDIEYTSPWAGADYLPMSEEADSRWEKNTWPELARLARDVPEAGIHFRNSEAYNRERDMKSASGRDMTTSLSPWYKDLLPDFRVLAKEELPLGMASGTAFTSVCINTPMYLSYLMGQCLLNGATIKRAVLTNISDAMSMHSAFPKADVVINCTGLLASQLGGVMDKSVYPIRGQVVVVRNDPGTMMCTSGTDDGPDETCYIMTRAAGGGTVLGGTYMEGSWESQPDPNQAVRIMKRAVELCPALTGGKGIKALSVIRHGVGLRPGRKGGVRIEKEKIGDLWIVHNYGHAGWGYQGSYGCSERVVELVKEILERSSKL